MCGIVAVLAPQGISTELCVDALRTLRHRGPDDEGVLLLPDPSLPPVACRTSESAEVDLPFVQNYPHTTLFLGHRRLSILDVTTAGHQPMCDSTGQVWITYNGEIYNFVEIRRELEAKGSRFHTGTDTEVVLAAYREWGMDMVRHFTGMFALCLCDFEKKQFILARDPFGIKPLYWERTEDGIHAASELKALLALRHASPVMNSEVVTEFLRFGYSDQGTTTFFRDLHQVAPGTWLAIDMNSGDLREVKYWTPSPGSNSGEDWETATHQVRALLQDSIEKHLRSDVPLGTCLSGGIDSSVIVSLIRESHPDMDIHGISFLADDPRISEEKWMRLVAEEKEITLHGITPTKEEFLSDVDHLIRLQDEPFCTTSIYAQYRVMKEARNQGVTVMLDGQGADELFGGYTTFFMPRIREELLRLRISAAFSVAKGYEGANGLPARQAVIAALPGLLPSTWRSRLRGRRTTDKPWLRSENPCDSVRTAETRRGDDLHAVLNESLTVSTLPMLLRFEDRNSMAHSIESRVPFLTCAIADYVRTLPPRFLISRDGVSKHVLRESMRGVLPTAILERKDKVGFTPPEKSWVLGMEDRVTEMLAETRDEVLPMVNLNTVRSLWSDIRSGTRPYTTDIWRLYNLCAWADLHGIGAAR